MALSHPFLDMTILYSFNNIFDEKMFKYEVWLCHEHLRMTLQEIFDTPVSDRKEYINIHNDIMRQRKEKMGGD